ncbi:MAG: hypothetical protein BM563_07630 [Bacteroidetes bacterium MedPE-SWsnd-G1]|nr:MAG: hypothetical protein BM563_07630 [Bacteroidetes bacterium MedPE-SWsnd-G1]
MKKVLIVLATVILLFICYLFFNLFTTNSKQIVVVPIDKIKIDEDVIKHLAQAIQIKTISTENTEAIDFSEFDKFNTFLKETYPLTDSLLDKKLFNSYSHLYLWKGSNTSLKPIVLMGHIDVVPVIEKNRKEWKEAPFKGIIKDDVIWGRGTMDDKVNVIGILEATEALLKSGFQPERSIYYAFGHDEEIGGNNGAAVMAKYLEDNDIEAEFILDEGSVITQGLIPGIDKDVALIGIAEKGSVSIQLSTKIEGGHSSMPSNETAIDVLSNAIAKLKANPFPAKLSQPLDGFIEYLGPEMGFPNNLVFANAGLFEGIITGIYEKSASGNAMVRTTTSPTIFNAGVKDNVIPQSASAMLNFRILPGETVVSVKERIETLINDDRITISEGGFNSDPSGVSNPETDSFDMLHKSIKEVYGDVLVAPTLVVAATDSKHYKNVSDNIYRFIPVHINQDNIKAIHGINERISVEDFKDVVRFYTRVLENSN